MEQLDLQQILKETRDSIRNGHKIEQLEIWKNQLKEIENKEDKQSLKYAIQILEEVIKLKREKNKTPRNRFKQAFLFLFFISLLFGVYATINYKINGDTKLSVGENETIISNILRGESPIKISEGITFIGEEGDNLFGIYRSIPARYYNSVPDVFNNTLIHEITQLNNQYVIEECWWNNETNTMRFCINAGAVQRATTIRRSLQIVGNKTVKPNDENFTLCEGANYVDCATDITGADLFIQDDIEAQSIYANENVYAEGSIDSESGIGVPVINAINVSTDNLNADLIQAILGKFTNIAVDNINADLLWITDIVVDNLEVTDLNTGGNAGTELCVDSNDVLCRCGSCA